LGFGVWVFGFGVWGMGPTPQSPIPNPQSPIPKKSLTKIYLLNTKFIKVLFNIFNLFKLIIIFFYHV
jgi:hypothetical protein